MPRGYRIAVFAAFGIGALCAGVVYGLNQQVFYEQEAQRRGADYAKRAADKVKQSCFGESASEKRKCAEIEASEYRLKIRDNQREQDDLAAQQTSALWTSLMGLAALIGMALSAVGVALVWTTFNETKRTNLIAMRENARNSRRSLSAGREAEAALRVARQNVKAASEQLRHARSSAERQLRAYVGIESGSLEGTLDPIADIIVKNFGQTPAYEFRAGCMAVVRPVGHQIGIHLPDTAIAPFHLSPSQKHLLSASVEDANSLLELANDEKLALYVMVACSFIDAYRINRSFFSCMVRTKEGGLAPYPFEVMS
jgi:hypothetical protein